MPFPRDDHYLYGSAHIQPYPAYYNSVWFRRKPPRRDLGSLMAFCDDGSSYIPDWEPADPNEPINRSKAVNSLINIETIGWHTIRIKLYALEEENDTDIILEIGKGYAITYITEGGLKVANGILRAIDTSIPDTCTRYIGEFNTAAITAWIAMDCSTTGKSDKRKIYIASIRAIQEIDMSDPDYAPLEVDPEAMSNSRKLSYLVSKVPEFMNKIDTILLKVVDNDEIITKLNEMDPNEKLDYIIKLLDKIDSESTSITLLDDDNEPITSDTDIEEEKI